MGIADLVVTAAKVRKGPPCTVCEALTRLSADDGAALTRLLSDPAVRYTELSASLAQPDIGLDLSAGTLSRHARGRCEARTKLRSA
jgi:hypothetical protein